MVKKLLISISVIAFLLPSLAFAYSFTASPNPVNSGSENTINLSWSGAVGTYQWQYLFTAAGANVHGNATHQPTTASGGVAWSTLGFNTGLTPGNYIVVTFGDNTGGDYSFANGLCGGTITYSNCLTNGGFGAGTYATTTLTVNSAARRKIILVP